MDSLCTNPSEQGLGGQYGCGGQGCAHICIHALSQCARNIQVGTVLLTAQPSICCLPINGCPVSALDTHLALCVHVRCLMSNRGYRFNKEIIKMCVDLFACWTCTVNSVAPVLLVLTHDRRL